MALKSTTNPLARMELSAWRTQICGIKGIDYSSMPTAWQTLFDDTVNRAHEYISQRAAHHPWGQQATTLTVTAGADSTYAMPAAFRHIVALHEIAADGSILQVNLTEKRVYFEAPKGESGSHPWATSRNPYWFFDGLTDAQPPVQQWRRIGEDNTGATAHVLYRPLFNILAADAGTQDDWPYLPGNEADALMDRISMRLAAAEKDWTGVQVHRALLEDSITALEVNDRDTVEAPRRLGVDPDFARQLG